jgi:hypothetical protein
VNWAAAAVDSDGDGVSNLQELLAGTAPTDAASVLKVFLTSSAQGRRLNWNTQPGIIYQVQTATNLGAWINEGTPRLAATNQDSIAVSAGQPASYYRIIRIR